MDTLFPWAYNSTLSFKVPTKPWENTLHNFYGHSNVITKMQKSYGLKNSKSDSGVLILHIKSLFFPALVGKNLQLMCRLPKTPYITTKLKLLCAFCAPHARSHERNQTLHHWPYIYQSENRLVNALGIYSQTCLSVHLL